MSNLCCDSLINRKSFSKISNNINLPNLIEVQSRSFNDFVQLDFLSEERENIGLEKVFRDIFPINYSNSMSLEYIGYELGNWACACGETTGINQRYSWSCESCHGVGVSRLDSKKTCPLCSKKTAFYSRCAKCLTRVKIKPSLNVVECRFGGQTFSFPLKVRVQLICYDFDENNENRIIKDVKEQDIFFLDLPVMTDIYEENDVYKVGNIGTFVINGVERVIVSQIHRSPGVIFSQIKKSRDSSSLGYSARIIPMRGSWVDFEIDYKDIMYVRIDKAKKILATTFLQALGIEKDDIAKLFYRFNKYIVKKDAVCLYLDTFSYGIRIEKGMLPIEYEDEYINKKITKEILEELESKGINTLSVKKAFLINRIFGEDLFDSKTGELIASNGDLLTEKIYEKIKTNENLKFTLLSSSGYVINPVINLTLQQDKCLGLEAAAKEIYNKIYPGDTAPVKEMIEKINNIFFNSKFYDLSKVGRIKINRKLDLNTNEEITHLTKEDFISTIRYLIVLREQGIGEIDDIDNLSNRRIRLVGELLANQAYSGMLRIERIVKERFRMHDINKSITPYDLINTKPLAGIIREFFATGQLSQFVDQTNPLSEIAHKRRLSSLGPGGVMKDRATYEVRDVHTSHYGRICPIETPEGQSIGLISSLATLAFVNNLGFIETPYYPVINGKIQNNVIFLDAFSESNFKIAQVEFLKNNDSINKNNEKVLCRYQGNFIYTDIKEIKYVDVSSYQLFSVATAMIPFLQHDDAVRALMGSNMQRQAVPLYKAEVPIVGTGVERGVANASRACITAKHAGTVEYVSADKIIVKVNEEEFSNLNDNLSNGIDTYHIRYFEGSSYDTCIHQVPIVKVGDVVKKDQLITNASAVVNGELSLGTNLLVAYMPWRGYNYEDAIVLNKRIVSENLFTSLHIEEYTIDARDTRLGPEEITSDIPNVSSSMLKALDEDGIIKVGARVKSGDILVGKVTLKGDVQYSPEEKLLRAIFGEKSREVRDTSLRLPAGAEGVVIDVKVFSRSGSRKDERYKKYVAIEVQKLNSEFAIHIKILEDIVRDNILKISGDKELYLKENDSDKNLKAIKNSDLKDLLADDLLKIYSKDSSINLKISKILKSFDIQLKVIEGLKEEKISFLRRGDQLPSGVLKMVKVYVASIRHMQVGDKMAGRHGNKGVVSCILPREDMPFMEDGTPVDVVLNPLGIPSRMNVGQVLEMMLGMCGMKIGKNFKKEIELNRIKSLHGEIEKMFGKDFLKSFIENHGEEGLEDLIRYISKNGMYFSASVFDSGNFEDNIKPLMESLNIPTSGTYKLRDGRTGEYFDQSVLVGVMYMMKLNHMVDDKLHARSVGPYSLVTQQPLGGKAQMGGQRFGEMEVWAIEAYGAAYMLQELLTYKSDDVIGRHKVYNAIVRGETVPEPGLPESFNVLVKELQALGLKIDLITTDKESKGE